MLSDDLKAVNERLWEIEEAIRVCEAQQDFGPRFVELARCVYRTNDGRTTIKRRINQRLGSELLEEKEYPCYDAAPVAQSSSGPIGAAETRMQVLYLNLERRKDRKDQFLNTNSSVADLEFRRWDAVDGQLLTIEQLLRSRAIEAPLIYYTFGALGGALSHKAVWDYCASRGEVVTVCEDDAVFNRYFAGKASAVLAQLPRDWDFVLWGWNFDSAME